MIDVKTYEDFWFCCRLSWNEGVADSKNNNSGLTNDGNNWMVNFRQKFVSHT